MKNLAIWRGLTGAALASLLLCAVAHAQDASAGSDGAAAVSAPETTAPTPASAPEAAAPEAAALAPAPVSEVAAPAPAPAPVSEAAAPASAPAPASVAAPAPVPAPATATSALPEIQRKNGIEFITGGIGIDESRAIQFEAEHWPLLITMAEITRGQSRAVWVANVDVSISRVDNKPVIDFRSDGPLALVRLEAGKYTIRARFNGVEEKRDFMVMAGMSQKLTILWKKEAR